MASRILTTALALVVGCGAALAAHANPVACELPGGIGAGDDDGTIRVRFLGACADAETYGQSLHIQWADGGVWVSLDGGSWIAEGETAADGGSGSMSYPVFVREVGCPAEGPLDVRLVWLDEDEEADDAWVIEEGSAPCGEAAGDDDDDATPPPTCGLVTGGDAAAMAGLALLGLLVARLRRRD